MEKLTLKDELKEYLRLMQTKNANIFYTPNEDFRRLELTIENKVKEAFEEIQKIFDYGYTRDCHHEYKIRKIFKDKFNMGLE